MSKVNDARTILKTIGMPVKQQSDTCVYSLLALTSIKENTSWTNAQSEWIRIHDIIRFTADNYDVNYAENSRETFRKQAIHHFRNAALIEDNGKATNSPHYRYRITDEALSLIKSFKTSHWDQNLKQFISNHSKLIDLYASKKKMTKMPVKIAGSEYSFSVGKHNQLQKAILEEFAPRFAENSECLYVGDTVKKDLVKNTETLEKLGFSITLHDKMPDVVLYRKDKNWLYFIEAVTSVGPMNPKRLIELKTMAQHVKAGIIFITAFHDIKTFKRFANEIAWETEIWISEKPDHMIHMNGDKFIGPR